MKKWVVTASAAMLAFAGLAHAAVECLSGDVARDVFVTEKGEPYFSLLQPREMAAKTGGRTGKGSLQQQRASVRTLYREAVLDCTQDDLEGLQSYLSIIEPALKSVYPGLTELPWRIVKVRDYIEGGLPHTRADAIVLPESMLADIAASSRMRQWQMGIMDILVHEQVHVIQRARPEEFAKLYGQWGFVRAAAIRGADAWLAAHQIVNPDGVDVLWVWAVPGTDRVIWPLVVLAGDNAVPSMPDDFDMVGIELSRTAGGYTVRTGKDDVPIFHGLADEPVYMEKFSGVSSRYHPNEIAADFLSRLSLWDGLKVKDRASAEQQLAVEQVIAPIRAWAQQVFANGEPERHVHAQMNGTVGGFE